MTTRGTWTLIGAAAVAILAAATGNASAYSYKTARGLYRDCNAAVSGGGDAAIRRQHCAEYLTQMRDAWNLDQAPGVCPRHIGDKLSHAYVYTGASEAWDFFPASFARPRVR